MNGLRLLELARPAIVLPPQTVIAATTAVNSNLFDLSNQGKIAVAVLANVNGTNSGGSCVVTFLQFNGTNSKAFTGVFAADVNSNTLTDVWTNKSLTATPGTLTMAPLGTGTSGSGTVTGSIALLDIDPSQLDINNGYNHLKVVVTGGSTGCFAGVIVFQKFPRISSPTAAPDLLST